MRKRASNAKYKKRKQAEKREAKDRAAREEEKRQKRPNNRKQITKKDLEGKEDDKVYLKRSGVGEDAGRGVFARRNFYEGDYITEYIGKLHETKIKSDYLIQIGSLFLDGDSTDREKQRRKRELGSYVNRPSYSHKGTRLQTANCFFAPDYKRKRVFVKALCFIPMGSELLANYGSTYPIQKRRKH